MTDALPVPVLPVGAVVTIGHPGNGRLAVMHSDGWRLLGGLRHGGPVPVEEWRAGWTIVGGPVPGVEQMLQVARADDGPPERFTDGFRAFAAATQGDRERARAILRGMPLAGVRRLAEVLDDLAGEVDMAENAATWQATAELARECQEAGLVVVKLQPRNGGRSLALDVSLWFPVEDRLEIWAEGRGEDADTMRRHIASYRQRAQAEALG
jgi:hypothetical protein